MLDGVYLDTVEEKALAAIRPKPGFHRGFKVAAAREFSDVALLNQPPQAAYIPKTPDSCLWWRR